MRCVFSALIFSESSSRIPRVPEAAKKRLRVIFEPFLNRTVDMALCGTIRTHTRALLLDAAAYFDAFEIPANMRNFFVFKCDNVLYRLTTGLSGSFLMDCTSVK